MATDSLPSYFANEPFLVRDALPVLGRARLRRRDLLVPARGLRAAPVLRDRAPAELAVRLLGPRQHFSHVTAAALWGLPVPASADLHVTTVGDGPVMRRKGVVGHRVAAADARPGLHRAIPVSTELEAWAECATILTVGQLVVAGDHLLRVRGGHDLAELEEVVARRHGRRGARALRDALAQVCVGAESPRETRLRLQLLREGVRLPLLNADIHDARGGFVARPDFVFGRERVCVEYDGDHHRTDRWTYRDDKRRREALADAGWRVLYLSDDDLRGALWAAFVACLRRALAQGESAAAANDSAPARRIAEWLPRDRT